MNLLLFGCTGFIGNELVPHLLKKGHKLTLISRQSPQRINNKFKNSNLSVLNLDPSHSEAWNQQSLTDALSTAEGIVNLVGEPIAEKRWSPQHLKKIKDSRIKTTQYLITAMCKLKKPPRVLVNASAIGYYGNSRTTEFSEESPCSKDFLGEVCREWEEKASNKPTTTRLVICRIGIVIGKNGGALGKMLPFFKAGLGGPIGSGRQWMSWIHRTDLCQILENGLMNESWEGVINCVAPDPVLMNKFARLLGTILNRPSILPVPAQILKVLLGDGAKVVLEGQKVKGKRLQELRFNFRYPSLMQALSVSTK